jgi:hypothetical protein
VTTSIQPDPVWALDAFNKSLPFRSGLKSRVDARMRRPSTTAAAVWRGHPHFRRKAPQ